MLGHLRGDVNLTLRWLQLWERRPCATLGLEPCPHPTAVSSPPDGGPNFRRSEFPFSGRNKVAIPARAAELYFGGGVTWYKGCDHRGRTARRLAHTKNGRVLEEPAWTFF